VGRCPSLFSNYRYIGKQYPFIEVLNIMQVTVTIKELEALNSAIGIFSDVIQTGIVGSALLCAPNVREGVYIPVCLTGIQAGIDGYLSVLKAHRDCLQENLETGRLVGICDEIYSIYLCEFLWKQSSFIYEFVKGMVGNLYDGGPNEDRLVLLASGNYITTDRNKNKTCHFTVTEDLEIINEQVK
jgi:hypothetical protein